MLVPGTQIAGYRIERLLGRGGMGRVYEATQLALERTVALKILNDDLGTDEAFRARFRREGRVQGALAHPHVVGVLEAGEVDGHLFIAMQLVDGPTLKDLVAEGTLEPARAVALLAQVADALDTAHAAGLTHRDIKPQNVLVGPGDHAYLADFGLTKTLSDSAGFTRTGQFMGTIDYISPEQINGEPATPASDIYALAAILYESVTGSVPFPRDTEAAVLFAHISGTPAPVTDLRPELPAELGDVIARGMAKQPGERPATATALLEAAHGALGRADRPEAAREAALGEHASGERGSTPRVLRRPFTDADFPPTMEPGSRLVPPESDPSLTVPDHIPPDLAELAATAQPEPAERRTADGGRRAGAALALGVAVAAVAGVALGGHGTVNGEATAPSRLSSTAANGTLAVSFPATWHQRAAPPAARLLGLTSPLSLGAVGGSGTFAVGVTKATTPSLLADAARKAVVGALAAPDRVRLGALSAYRYRGVRLRGVPGSADLFAAPTSAGVVTLACTAGSADCARIAGSVRLQHGAPSSLGADPAYAGALGRTMVNLNEQRADARTALAHATGPKSEATAALAAAAAYRKAFAALGRAAPGPAEQAAHAAMRGSVHRAQQGYARLATAARRGQRQDHAAAAVAIRRAEHDLGMALAQLKALGYRVG